MTDELDKTMAPQRAGSNDFDVDKTMPGYRDRQTDGRFAVGDLIMGRYKVLAELGKGGMGIVYKCEDQTSHVCYAVKTLAPELTDSKWEMEEILYNFQLVQKLHHPNIANYNALELDPQTNRYFLVMEYVEGEDLRYWLRSKRREGADLQQVIPPVVRQIAQALDYAHSQKIVHRDIKPGNIMIDGEGNVKVLDFGLAAQIHSSLSRVSIQSVNEASTCGTIPYMAPEQWRGGEAEAASDQYALAATVYEMFSGRPPFDSADKDILRNCTLHEAPRPLKDVSPAIRSAVEKALAKEPEDRFNSCADFAAALGGAKVAKSKKVSSGKSGGAWKWIIFSILAVLLVAGGFFGIRTWQFAQMVKKAEEQGLILSDDKYTVVGVEDKNVESIEIPDGIRYIGNEAFAGCRELKSVTIPDSVRGIGASAFYWCYNLRSITIPDSVTSIGDYAFQDSLLRSISIPSHFSDEDVRKWWVPSYCKICHSVEEKNKAEAEARAKAEAEERKIKEEPTKTIYLDNGVSLTMIGVAPGIFMMGSENGERDETVHPVELTRAYYLGKTEVTQAQWRAVMGNNPSRFQGDSRPVECVSWNDAMAFCRKLNDQDRAPEGWKFTLPTEAQWEFAARGGNKSRGYTYSGSNNIHDVAWYWGNSGDETHAVRQKRANELGLYDMSGNVREWCLDRYGSYSSGAVTDPQGPDNGSSRVLRGGSWERDAQECRSAYRYEYSDYRYSFFGFRLALVPVQ